MCFLWQKGQHLEPFIQSFFNSCESPKPKPSRPELTILSPTSENDKKVRDSCSRSPGLPSDARKLSVVFVFTGGGRRSCLPGPRNPTLDSLFHQRIQVECCVQQQSPCIFFYAVLKIVERVCRISKAFSAAHTAPPTDITVDFRERLFKFFLYSNRNISVSCCQYVFFITYFRFNRVQKSGQNSYDYCALILEIFQINTHFPENKLYSKQYSPSCSVHPLLEHNSDNCRELGCTSAQI